MLWFWFFHSLLCYMGVPKVLADLRARVGSIDPERPVVGILAFEVAAVMSRFVSLHRSLAEDEVRRLRTDMRSQGVAYLTSKDQPFLLRLACAELVAELDKAAAAVSRIAAKCQDPLLRGFDRIYDGLKAGVACPVLRGGRVAENWRGSGWAPPRRGSRSESRGWRGTWRRPPCCTRRWRR